MDDKVFPRTYEPKFGRHEKVRLATILFCAAIYAGFWFLAVPYLLARLQVDRTLQQTAGWLHAKSLLELVLGAIAMALLAPLVVDVILWRREQAERFVRGIRRKWFAEEVFDSSVEASQRVWERTTFLNGPHSATVRFPNAWFRRLPDSHSYQITMGDAVEFKASGAAGNALSTVRSKHSPAGAP